MKRKPRPLFREAASGRRPASGRAFDATGWLSSGAPDPSAFPAGDCGSRRRPQSPYKVDLRSYRKAAVAQTSARNGRRRARRLQPGAVRRARLALGRAGRGRDLPLIGVILGAFSGFYGGWVDSVLMRLADIVLSFPALILIITVVSVLGPSIYNIMLVIGCWAGRRSRGSCAALFLSLREREFVLASRTRRRRERRGSSSATCCRTRSRR